MSGGSLGYLCRAFICFETPWNLIEMAESLEEGSPERAATEDIIECYNKIYELGNEENLTGVWQAIEWSRSGDWGAEQVREAVSKYRDFHAATMDNRGRLPIHDIEQNKCPKCGLKSDMNWPWCNPTGPRWGMCLNEPECDGKSNARLAFEELSAAIIGATVQNEELSRLKNLVTNLFRVMRVDGCGSIFTQMTDLEDASGEAYRLLEAEYKYQDIESKPRENMSFGEALELMKKGYKLTRQNWLDHDDIGGKWASVRALDGKEPEIIYGFDENIAISYKRWEPWPRDLLAEDWREVKGGAWPSLGIGGYQDDDE